MLCSCKQTVIWKRDVPGNGMFLENGLRKGRPHLVQGVGLDAVIQRDLQVLSDSDTSAVMAYLRLFR